jgi:hypothetical protein
MVKQKNRARGFAAARGPRTPLLAALLLAGGMAAGAALPDAVLPGAAFAASAAAAEGQIVLSRPWARLRGKPAETARAVAIVYGNDVLTVLERKDGWTRVKAAEKAEGWLSPQDASGAPPPPKPAAPHSPPAPPASAPPRGAAGSGPAAAAALPPLPTRNTRPASTDSLRRLGYEEAARRKLTEVLLLERDTPAAYRATRDMLTYHPVGSLPPLQGNTVPKEDRDTARRLREAVLLAEGRTLDRDGKSWDAILLYESMDQSDPKDGRAHLALLDTLTRFMERSAKSPNMENLGLAASIYRKAFPDRALPAAVQARLKDEKK